VDNLAAIGHAARPQKRRPQLNEKGPTSAALGMTAQVLNNQSPAGRLAELILKSSFAKCFPQAQ